MLGAIHVDVTLMRTTLLQTYTPFHANGTPSRLWPLSAGYSTLPQSKNGSRMIRGAQQ